jgi:hypothetical protein
MSLRRDVRHFPDGQRFLMIKQAGQGIPPQIIVVQNWLEELKRLLPTSR